MNTNKHNPITAGNLLGSDPDFTGNETTDGYMRRIRGRVAKSVTSITPTELAEWRAVVEKATPGPLTVDDGDSSLIGVFGNDGTVVCYMSEIEPAGYRRGYDSDRANAELFALARKGRVLEAMNNRDDDFLAAALAAFLFVAGIAMIWWMS